VSCYFRHLKDIFAAAGIEVTPQNRKQLDRVFHGIVGVEFKECPATWKKLKQDWLADPEKKRKLALIAKEALSKQSEQGRSGTMAVRKATATKKAPVKKAARKVAAKPFTKGDKLECQVCGLAVVIDTECDCVEACEIICCEQPMKPRKANATRAKAKAAAK